MVFSRSLTAINGAYISIFPHEKWCESRTEAAQQASAYSNKNMEYYWNSIFKSEIEQKVRIWVVLVSDAAKVLKLKG